MPLSESDANARGVISSDPYEARRQLQNNPNAQFYYAETPEWGAANSSAAQQATIQPSNGSWRGFFIACLIIVPIMIYGFTHIGQPDRRVQQELLDQKVREANTPEQIAKRAQMSAKMIDLAKLLDAEFSYSPEGQPQPAIIELVKVSAQFPKKASLVEGYARELRNSFMEAYTKFEDGRRLTYSIRQLSKEGTYEAKLKSGGRDYLERSLRNLAAISKQLREEPRAEAIINTMPNARRVWPKIRDLEEEVSFAMYGIARKARTN